MRDCTGRRELRHPEQPEENGHSLGKATQSRAPRVPCVSRLAWSASERYYVLVQTCNLNLVYMRTVPSICPPVVFFACTRV